MARDERLAKLICVEVAAWALLEELDALPAYDSPYDLPGIQEAIANLRSALAKVSCPECHGEPSERYKPYCSYACLLGASDRGNGESY